jgi:hypothetical protein
MNPEDTYVSKVKGIPGGQIKIVWSVIWNMVPIIAAAAFAMHYTERSR